jgi:hypothetical protein
MCHLEYNIETSELWPAKEIQPTRNIKTTKISYKRSLTSPLL